MEYESPFIDIDYFADATGASSPTFEGDRDEG